MASPRWAAQRVAHPRLSRGPRRPGRRARSGLWARDGVQSRRRRGRPGSNGQTGRGDGHDRHYLLLIAIIVLLGGGVTWAVTQLRSDEVTQWLQQEDQLVGIIVVSDPDHRVGFEVVFADTATGQVALLFVPGNLGTLIASRNRMDALETVYQSGSTKPLTAQLSGLLGVEPQFVLDLTGPRMRDLIDLVGGVEVFIPEPVDAPSAAGRVLLPSGAVLLDGDKALHYLGYTVAGEPLVERAARIHRLHHALLRRLHEQRQLMQHESVHRLLYRQVDTDLTTRGFATLLAALSELHPEQVIFQYALGHPQLVDGRTLLFPYYEGGLVREAVAQIVANLASADARSGIGGGSDYPATVEILNGTAVAGLARRTANLFQSFGYSVVNIANADHDQHASTIVIDRSGLPELVAEVAELLSCSDTRTATDLATDIEADVTIVLGGDFNGRRCTG